MSSTSAQSDTARLDLSSPDHFVESYSSAIRDMDEAERFVFSAGFSRFVEESDLRFEYRVQAYVEEPSEAAVRALRPVLHGKSVDEFLDAGCSPLLRNGEVVKSTEELRHELLAMSGADDAEDSLWTRRTALCEERM